MLAEGAGALVALVGALWSLARLAAARREALTALAASRADARAWQGEATRWRSEAEAALTGLGKAIDAQFERWGLTRAEAEVGLLLLKGLSHREVAEVRGTSERTAREQARAVYRKSGLAGRAELSAFFLEDLLLPAVP